MRQVKRFTAKQASTLDCGHGVKPGQEFLVTSVYTCEEDAGWPLKVLMACFRAQPKAPAKGQSTGQNAGQRPAKAKRSSRKSRRREAM
jgi:hypothetical protein